MKEYIKEILLNYDEDDYKSYCQKADYYGMECLTEEEQIVTMYWKEFN